MADSADQDSSMRSELSMPRKVSDIEERDRQRSRSKDKYSRPHDDEGSGHNRRSRSRSPRNERPREKPRRKDAGFKWKEKRRDDDDDRPAREEGLRRGYRDQERRDNSERYRPSDRDTDRDRHRHGSRDRDRAERRLRGDRESEHHRRRSRSPKGQSERDRGTRQENRPRPVQAAPAAVPPSAQQEMIVVYVNDRLGTKKAIPCFASDRIKEFKIIVASMIGRQPHEILLKRQGERPFKDMLTLQDYGVSNNVQLDLEVDTGD